MPVAAAPAGRAVAARATRAHNAMRFNPSSRVGCQPLPNLRNSRFSSANSKTHTHTHKNVPGGRRQWAAAGYDGQQRAAAGGGRGEERRDQPRTLNEALATGTLTHIPFPLLPLLECEGLLVLCLLGRCCGRGCSARRLAASHRRPQGPLGGCVRPSAGGTQGQKATHGRQPLAGGQQPPRWWWRWRLRWRRRRQLREAGQGTGGRGRGGGR